MNSVFFLVLRRMRAPLIALIVFYAVAVLGLTLVPGVNADGTAAPPMSFFHAFYFISYTATTIGFGEIPNAFSDAQRMWVTLCIYITVIGWSYSILTLLALLQDKSFQQTLVASRFARRVARIQTPFYLVCGCGETGSLICRALDLMGFDFVILDKDTQRIEELDLEDFKTNDPALAADARLSVNLLMAGVRHAQCRGVLAVTNDDECNLAIAINVRLLNPEVQVLTRVRNPAVAANMRSFGTHHIVNAYERFAEYLALAVSAPEAYRLIEVLTGLPGSPLPAVHRPPRGKWIVCGYGHFGQAVSRYMTLPGIDLTIVDPDGDGPQDGRLIVGSGTEAGVLHEAGVMEACGIVAGSNNDVANLSIAMMAKQLNPKLYVVARQNQAANDLLFDTFRADFSMVHTRVVAQECISVLTTPLLARFLKSVREARESWCKTLAMHLEAICDGEVPLVWDIRLTPGTAPAVHKALQGGLPMTVGDVMRDNADRDAALQGVVLMVDRDGQAFLLPNDDFTLREGDALLLAGKREVRSVTDLTLKNANALDYVMTGRDLRGGWVWRALFGKKDEAAVREQ
ncbi:potassium channel family protein [Noviherbaspirillum denitrificans]|uniref:Potassium transporter TrkA n=1 Tax=Noviherbaspirillum denitrificans TaxID=1968433 RepID=A0A254THM5_9BURK|nr:potassium channel protein [Noviherbaspirillum denitrificans]OWW19178.1 potassium transporter TrkA [Noviherbaspirillum denitrificans]